MADRDAAAGESSALRTLYRFLKSTRLAVVLILVITVLALLASLVPQHNPDPWYAARYGAGLHAVIHALGFEWFFRSALFLVPVALFTVNLGVCAMDRLVGRARRRAAPRFGPDLVHLGLLVLMAGGLATALGRQETTVSLSTGQEASVSPAYSVSLLSFQFLRWPDGSPKAWISTVSVAHDGIQEIGSYPIEVNHPLRLPGLKVYQLSYDVSGTLSLDDGNGKPVTTPPLPGDYFELDGARWVFAWFEPGTPAAAVFQQYRGGALASTVTVHAGDTIGPFTVRGVEAASLTVLAAVRDPGAAPFLAAAVLLVAGLALTFVQGRGDTPA